jgi:3-oxoacyl-[acyl-carrier protein] reductase
LFGSQSVVLGGNEIAVYASTKAAIETLVKSLAREVGSYGLRFNCISPASIKTKKIIEMDEDAIKSTIERIPLGRLGRPEEVAELIIWLFSLGSSYINGSTIPITGGK